MRLQLDLLGAMNNDVNLLLIGKTGNGKSATGNSILQRSQFVAKSSFTSVTQATQSAETTFGDRKLFVVDIPGVGDTEMTEERAVQHVQNALAEAMRRSVHGYDAFLVVLRFGSRFTAEERNTISSLKDMLGADFVERYCIVVITCGDQFESEPDVVDEGLSFEDWCHKQRGHFRQFLEECQDRVVLFNNREKNATKKKAQISKLLALVDRLSYGRYSSLDYRRAEPSRRRMLLQIKEPEIRKETSEKVDALRKQLNDAKEVSHLDSSLSRLRGVLNSANRLHGELKEEDGGTGVLNMAMRYVTDIIGNIKTQIGICELQIQNKRREEEAEEKRRRLEEERRRREKESGCTIL